MTDRVLSQRELNRALLARQLLLERGRSSLPKALAAGAQCPAPPRRDTSRAMSQENVEIVRRFLDQAPETPDAVWDIFDDDVEWETGGLAMPDFPRTSHGPDGVREFFRRWVGTFENWGYDVEEFIDGRDEVAVRIHQC